MTDVTVTNVPKILNVAHLRECEGGLRTLDKDSEDYRKLVESVRVKGFFGAITVRLMEDPVTQASYYQIVDGLHRWSAAKECGLTEIPCVIVNYNDDEFAEVQLMANVNRVATRPADVSKQLLRIINNNPMISEQELAARLGNSVQWVQQRLSLGKITDDGIRELINNGSMKLGNAVMLAKLPEDEQADFLEQALSMQSSEFVPLVNERVSAIRAARRSGDSDTATKVFDPKPMLRKLTDIAAMHESGNITSLLGNITDPAEAASFALAWVIRMDEESIRERQAEYDDRETKKAAAAELRKAEREAKKKADAQEKAKLIA